MRLILRLFLIPMILFVSSCARHTIPDTPAPNMIGDFAKGYQLQRGDRVRLNVFNEANLSGEFTVDTSGKISLPLIGTVIADGATAATLQTRVEEVLVRSGYLHDPKISVEIVTYRPFYVLGEVKSPGEFPYTVGMSVLSAVARAGGYDYRAREGTVILSRMTDGVSVDYRADERTPIAPGDIIRVTERYF